MKPRKEATVKSRGKSELQFESRVSMRGGAVVSQARSNQSHAARITFSIHAGVGLALACDTRRWIRHVQSRLSRRLGYFNRIVDNEATNSAPGLQCVAVR